ncbi:DUF3261 domain-containing protein [Shewanella livingstonensis]|uniref:DUF3261 domain-containing protein n=1 Tax=Shewanella livingstonensis TaxID=150120 RepID=A0A3G8M1N3_9GAMM|nr:DUF3261 domain-containing protein [Shewanella livingstonensis]
MNVLSRRVVALFLLSLLTACSQQIARQTCVPLTGEAQYCLSPTSTVLTDAQHQDINLTQMVNFTRGQDSHELLTQLELNPQRMTLVGLAPFGQALFTLVYDGQTLQSEQSLLLGGQFKAEYLMAIMQLIYWPTEQVNQQLSGGKLIAKTCNMALCKQLVDDNGALITLTYNNIDPWLAQVNIDIDAADIHLQINPIE